MKEELMEEARPEPLAGDDAGALPDDGAADGVETNAADGVETDAAAPADEDQAGDGVSVVRRVATWTITVLAGVFVLGALVAPFKVGRLEPGAFARLPVEGLLLVAVVVLAPARVRRPVALLAGAGIGLMAVMKAVDMGFYQVLNRPFDPVLDWVLVGSGVEFLDQSVGRGGAIAAVIGIVLLIGAVLSLMALSVLRLTRLVIRHNAAATCGIGVLGTAWVACAALGAQLVPGVPVASKNTAALTWAHTRQVANSIRDRQAFAKQAAVDAFRDTPGQNLLGGLRGKDVLLAFVESYGRSAVEDPRFASQVGAVLDDGSRRLRKAGFASRSGWLTSPTTGGGSWLAHSTLLSGLWVDNQQRYRSLVSSDRLTLNNAFRRADWRSVAFVPGVTRAWPEGDFFGYDQVYNAYQLGYRGPPFGFATMPDQYTLQAFQRLERSKPNHAPVMAEIPLVSSHAPWAPLPELVDWKDLGDGSVFRPIAKAGKRRATVWRDPARVRNEYRRSIEYTLGSLISYMEKYGDDDLVLVFLGDHQPVPIVTGEGASRDVPITVVARDPAVLDRISGWGWQDGLKPGPKAPVWPMHTFRDRFLTAFAR
ncbi:sulfatase [Actinomadura vinacea]|uniref:sulfatase n=1 Tax=Actinomadura vinacea TaxID=115336 RepID=UPI0031E2AB99